MTLSNNILSNVRLPMVKRFLSAHRYDQAIRCLLPELNFTRISSRSMVTSNTTKTTCLIDFHKRRQARMEPFAGYLMPIVYKDQTIKSEHLQTRGSASVFDVSHMMQTIVRGKDRFKFLESLTVADIQNLALGKCTLSVFTNESGGIIDDCIISKREDHVHIVSNAGNSDIVWNWLNEKLNKSIDVSLEKLTNKGLIAVQGPKAAQVLQNSVDDDLSDIEFMNTRDLNIKGVGSCQVTRCGYTGEDGFEISVEASSAGQLLDHLCQQSEVKPAGLGARDTLRLEAGLCLHGHDINDKISPVEAALSWTIHKRRKAEGGFLGSQKILEQLKENSGVKRVGLVAVGSGPPAREGTAVTELDDKILGFVTSGTFGPTIEKNIAMAYLPSNLAVKFGHSVNCIIRGKKFEYKITKMPFVKANYYLKNK